MNVTVFGLKNCDRTRAAARALEAAGHQVTLRDVGTEGLEPEMIERLLESFGDAIINRRSTTWRALGESERAAAPAGLLAAHPKLMRRPVLALEDGRLLPGWEQTCLEELVRG